MCSGQDRSRCEAPDLPVTDSRQKGWMPLSSGVLARSGHRGAVSSSSPSQRANDPPVLFVTHKIPSSSLKLGSEWVEEPREAAGMGNPCLTAAVIQVSHVSLC